MRFWKPIFVHNSGLPKLLSWFSPICIGAITLGFVVVADHEMDEETLRHETIHFQQFLEMGFLFFIFVYVWDWVWGCIKYKDPSLSYYMIRAEREAHKNDKDPNYLKNRVRYEWLYKDDDPLVWLLKRKVKNDVSKRFRIRFGRRFYNPDH
tara:strand:- start:534 stop:986 length:453 start_codon:yes stop_codon:yes gene_type:complete